MIELVATGEHLSPELVATYDDLEDARSGLYDLECALEDATSGSRISYLRGLIEQLEHIIYELEEQ